MIYVHRVSDTIYYSSLWANYLTSLQVMMQSLDNQCIQSCICTQAQLVLGGGKRKKKSNRINACINYKKELTLWIAQIDKSPKKPSSERLYFSYIFNRKVVILLRGRKFLRGPSWYTLSCNVRVGIGAAVHPYLASCDEDRRRNRWGELYGSQPRERRDVM